MLFTAVVFLSAFTWITLFQESTDVQNHDGTKIVRAHGQSQSDRKPVHDIKLQSTSRSNNLIASTFSKLKRPAKPKEDIQAILKEEHLSRKRWTPCTSKYELERHDHEPRHGDICRIKGGIMSYYECPEGCHETAGNPPFCAENTKNFAGGGKPCRARNPNAEPEYRCDDVGVCVLAVGSPKAQFKGKGEYFDDTCDGMCGDKSNVASFVNRGEKAACTSDLDCSLAGVCLPNGTCECDPWADGPDCSYLRFQPVDKTRLGYINERHSSWGGSIIYSSVDQMYHMYVSEIICKIDPDTRKRCGLGGWETHSRIVVAKSVNIDGPYHRNGIDEEEIVLHPEHHNPSIHVSPTTGEWHLFTISGSTGPIERMISKDQGKTWGAPMTISPRQNPGPLMRPDGSTFMYYRADGMDLPSPTCSDEGIALQICPVDQTCHPPNDIPIFGHTGEDPSVFVDHRGNYHMLFNALPYKCVPKFNQGGHAWSNDGVNWNSNPRVGAFDTTIHFADGTNIKCERRERPQMVVGADGRPLALVTGMTGCPKGLISATDGNGAEKNGNAKFYRGGDDSFTLVQFVGS